VLVEEDHRRLWKDADVEQPDDVAAGVGGPSSSHRERMPGRTSRWGRGSLGHTQDDHQTFDRGRRCARAVAVVGTRTGGALACRPKRASARPVETPAYQRSSCAAARGAFQRLLRFVQLSSERSAEARR
jgi:hypothetical protein